MNTLLPLLERRVRALELARAASRDGNATSARLHEIDADEIDAEIRRHFAHVDIEFRSAILAGRYIELQTRDLGATAHGQLNDRSFIATFFSVGVGAAPLFELATRVDTTTGADIDFSFTLTNVTANGVVAQGSSITESDPTFGGGELAPFAYKDIFSASAELVTDSMCDFERLAAQAVAPVTFRKASDDLWGGNGTTAPQGLLAGLTTVNAAGAAVVAFDDVAALLAGVPDKYWPNLTILLSPGAYVDLLEEQPTHAWHTGTIHGRPFRVDPALAAPASAAKSVVAGDFRSAYVVRVVPTRVESDATNGFNDQVRFRVVLRVDGRRLVTDAARALVHP